MKKLLIPLATIMVLAVFSLPKNDVKSPIMRSIASADIEKERKEKKDEEEEENALENLLTFNTNNTTGTSGNDCIECRMAELKIQNLYEMIQVYAMNERILNQLNTPSYSANPPSIMDQMSNFSNQYFATNPLVTESLNQYGDGSGQSSLLNSLSSSEYGFDYNSHLGIQQKVELTEPAFNFEAPAMDSSPEFRRMDQFRGFQFKGQTDSSDLLVDDSVELYTPLTI